MAWTEEQIERELRRFTRRHPRWPRRRDFEAAGQSKLLRAVYRNGGARYWAQRLGLGYPADRRGDPANFWTRPDLSKKKTKLARARVKAGISQGELAIRTGISRSTLQRLESGKTTNPTLQSLVKIAVVLGIGLEEIVEDRWLEARPEGTVVFAPSGRARWTGRPD